jgi:hypothetical protein
MNLTSASSLVWTNGLQNPGNDLCSEGYGNG